MYRTFRNLTLAAVSAAAFALMPMQQSARGDDDGRRWRGDRGWRDGWRRDGRWYGGYRGYYRPYYYGGWYRPYYYRPYYYGPYYYGAPYGGYYGPYGWGVRTPYFGVQVW